MAYADFTFYQNQFRGGQIGSEEEYLSADAKAACYLDWLTNGRIKRLAQVPDGVRMAECAVSELYQSSSARRGIHSEANDGYQVVYEEPDERNMYREAVRYLPDGLAFRGIGI